MKISIICSIISGFGRRGFYQSQEIGLGRALAARGHEVVICKAAAREAEGGSVHRKAAGPAAARNPAGDAQPAARSKWVSEQIAERLILRTIPVRHIGVHGLLPAGVIDADSDAVFAFADTQLAVRGMDRYCSRHHILFIPYVGIAHSFRAGLKARAMEFLYRRLTLPVYRRCTVAAKTEGARQELLGQGVPDCVVAPVGLDRDDLHRDFGAADRSALRGKWGFEPADVIVSFIARLEPEKRPLDMIDLFAEMEEPRKKLLMVGKGPLLGEVRERIRERGLKECVVILPELPHDQMWELHTIADFFVSLRTDEIFGMALMEAVYYRSTVLSRRAPGPEEILEGVSGGSGGGTAEGIGTVSEEQGGYKGRSGNVSAGTAAHHLCDTDGEIVQWLNAGPSEEAALRAAQERLVKRFTWDRCADVIESLAERGREA